MDGKRNWTGPANQAPQLCLHLPIPVELHSAGLQDGSRHPMVFQQSAAGQGITRRLPAAEAWAVGRCVQHHSDTNWTGIYLDLDLADVGGRVRTATGVITATVAPEIQKKAVQRTGYFRR